MIDFRDPNLWLFLGLLGSVCGGAVQATRATRIDSRWLPLLSAVWGVIVTLAASFTPGNPLSGVQTGGILLTGLMVGLATTGLFTLGVHWGAGSTGGASTAKAP